MLETGTILAGYRIDALLGKGGMGAVYVATQLSLNRTVALKVLAPHLSEDETFRERFRREGLVQAALDHPHIVAIHEAGETEQGVFLAMRLIRGRNLKERILAGELDAERTLAILGPVASALDAAHEAGLVHRDVKPQNILVGADDRAYLADFGLGRPVDEGGLTKTGELVGTLDYLSPEQVLGKPASARSDIYALGAVLYECLTGVVPYPRDSDGAILYAHVSEPAPVVGDQRPELPASLNAVIARAMAKKPGQRVESATALMQAAEAALLEAGPLGAPAASAKDAPAPATDVHTLPIAPAERDERACPSCGAASSSDGGFCPYCGAAYAIEEGAFTGFAPDDFTYLADPMRHAARGERLEARVRELWEAAIEALAGDRDCLEPLEVRAIEQGDQWLRSSACRAHGPLAISLTMTPRELQLALEGSGHDDARALVAWLGDEERAEALEELAAYRLIVWTAPPGPAGVPAASDDGRRIFDRDAPLIDVTERRELIALMSAMEALTGMRSLWRRPPFALRTTVGVEEAVRLGGELPALVGAELARLLALARDIDGAAAASPPLAALAGRGG